MCACVSADAASRRAALRIASSACALSVSSKGSEVLKGLALASPIVFEKAEAPDSALAQHRNRGA